MLKMTEDKLGTLSLQPASGSTTEVANRGVSRTFGGALVLNEQRDDSAGPMHHILWNRCKLRRRKETALEIHFPLRCYPANFISD